MASKTFTHLELGQITVYKRRGSRRVSLRVHGGHIRITQPFWLPYAQGLKFAEKNHTWIHDQRQQRTPLITDGQAVGKRHVVKVLYGETLSCRVRGETITVTIPYGQTISSEQVQERLRKSVKTALVKEAKELLPARLEHIARTYGFSYNGLTIKSMRSRWGSCTSRGIIHLNCYLMEAPWELIDYVLLHELVHTEHLHHGPAFWAAVEQHMPDFRTRRKAIRDNQQTYMAYR